VALLLCALLVLAAAAGCGKKTNRLSPVDFRTQANRVCAKYQAKLKALPAPNTLAEVDGYVSKALPLFTGEIGEIRALTPPSNFQTQVDRMLSRAEDTVAAARKLRAAAHKGDEAAARQALKDGQAASSDADKAARSLGLTACAN